MKRIEEKNLGKSTLLAFMLIPLAGLATDIFLPSLPGMANYLHISQSAVQLLIILFMTSSGISQIFTGALLDSFGRYRINIISIFSFAVISFLITIIPNIYLIYVLRVLQGVFVSFIIVGKRAYFADVYSGEKLKSYTSLFSVVWSVAPIIAPFIGGYLEHHFGWKANFYFLSVFTLLLLLFELKFSGESLPKEKRQPFDLGKIGKVYKTMLGTRDFSLGLLIIGFNYTLQILYSISSPFLIEEQYHFSPVVTGNCALILGIALMSGGLTSKKLIDFSLRKKLYWSVTIQLILSIAMLIVSQYYSNIYTLVGFAFAINFLSGFIFNNVYSYCLTRFTSNAGTASGLTGGGIYIISSIMNYAIVKSVAIKTQITYTYLNVALILIIFLLIIFFQTARKRSLKLALNK